MYFCGDSHPSAEVNRTLLIYLGLRLSIYWQVANRLTLAAAFGKTRFNAQRGSVTGGRVREYRLGARKGRVSNPPLHGVNNLNWNVVYNAR